MISSQNFHNIHPFLPNSFHFSKKDKSRSYNNFFKIPNAFSNNEQAFPEKSNLTSRFNDALQRNYDLETNIDLQEFASIHHIKSFLFLKKITKKSIDESRLLEKRLAEKVVMNMKQLLSYKTMPCITGKECKNCPRKIVDKNDFKDNELDCYFYHHEKDQRRFVLRGTKQEEFSYSGNFCGKKEKNEKGLSSVNFFESLFHPLYYKNFHCVRENCQESVFCPYFHSKQEKVVWDYSFMEYFGKDRNAFTKKKDVKEWEEIKCFKKKSRWQRGVVFARVAISK